MMQNFKFIKLKILNYMKVAKFFFFLMIKNNITFKLFKTNKNSIKNKFRLNKPAKFLFMNSIVLKLSILITNSVIFLEIKSRFLYNYFINKLLIHYIIGARLNNKIYSKFCIIQFFHSYYYFINKKLIYKFFTLRLKKHKTNN